MIILLILSHKCINTDLILFYYYHFHSGDETIVHKTQNGVEEVKHDAIATLVRNITNDVKLSSKFDIEGLLSSPLLSSLPSSSSLLSSFISF